MTTGCPAVSLSALIQKAINLLFFATDGTSSKYEEGEFPGISQSYHSSHVPNMEHAVTTSASIEHRISHEYRKSTQRRRVIAGIVAA